MTASRRQFLAGILAASGLMLTRPLSVLVSERELTIMEAFEALRLIEQDSPTVNPNYVMLVGDAQYELLTYGNSGVPFKAVRTQRLRE